MQQYSWKVFIFSNVKESTRETRDFNHCWYTADQYAYHSFSQRRTPGSLPYQYNKCEWTNGKPTARWSTLEAEVSSISMKSHRHLSPWQEVAFMSNNAGLCDSAPAVYGSLASAGVPSSKQRRLCWFGHHELLLSSRKISMVYNFTEGTHLPICQCILRSRRLPNFHMQNTGLNEQLRCRPFAASYHQFGAPTATHFLMNNSINLVSRKKRKNTSKTAFILIFDEVWQIFRCSCVPRESIV